MAYQYLIVETDDRGFARVQFNRPKQLNALCQGMLDELCAVLTDFESDDTVRAVVLTGNERAFAAGADISELMTLSAVDARRHFASPSWRAIEHFRKPIIAAVRGLALGGGLELVMQCDMVVVGDEVSLGLPEVTLGVIPGAGGTQRLPGIVGKALAMEMILNGRTLNAAEAINFGLANYACPGDEVLAKAEALAAKLAQRPPMAVEVGKECVNAALNETLDHGLATEQRLFHFLFATEDRAEGFKAFIEKRAPQWSGK
ncbi:MAG: enoyl-CoA hydratase/isomerase family protein [Porticoccaceae bacterium]|nr:enoyl-CoA hydratase/isomerase family protein [Porticoccaceae bacterium]